MGSSGCRLRYLHNLFRGPRIISSESSPISVRVPRGGSNPRRAKTVCELWSLFTRLPWVLPPLSNSWIIGIIWLYIALNRTHNIDCYCVGAVPKGYPWTGSRLVASVMYRVQFFVFVVCAEEGFGGFGLESFSVLVYMGVGTIVENIDEYTLGVLCADAPQTNPA